MWKLIGISCAGMLLALGAVEILFRLAAPSPASLKPDDRPKRYYFSAASADTRDYHYNREKDPGTYRIVVIGDSFTYGYGNQFDDAFPKRLERMLNLNTKDLKVEVLNFGMPGHSTRDEVRTMHEVLAHWFPDLVILEITLNDPEMKQFNPHDRKMDRDGGFVVSGGVFDYWKSLAFVVARIRNTMSVFQYKHYFQSLFQNEETLRNFRISLRNIKDLAEDSKVNLVAVVFPLVTFPLDDTYPFFHAHDVIHQLLDALHVPYVDLFKAFRGLEPRRLQADPGRDPHPNEIAHRIAAEAIYAWLAKERLIPWESVIRFTSKERQGPSKLRRRRIKPYAIRTLKHQHLASP